MKSGIERKLQVSCDGEAGLAGYAVVLAWVEAVEWYRAWACGRWSRILGAGRSKEGMPTVKAVHSCRLPRLRVPRGGDISTPKPSVAHVGARTLGMITTRRKIQRFSGLLLGPRLCQEEPFYQCINDFGHLVHWPDTRVLYSSNAFRKPYPHSTGNVLRSGAMVLANADLLLSFLAGAGAGVPGSFRAFPGTDLGASHVMSKTKFKLL